MRVHYDSHEQENFEWEKAHEKLDGKPIGSKYRHKSPDGVTHSFLVIASRDPNGLEISKIIAMSRKRGILGAGAFGTVRIAEDEQGKLYAVKKIVGRQNEAKNRALEDEGRIAHELNKSESPVKRLDKMRSYVPYFYLGPDLNKYLETHRLTQKQQYRLAKKIVTAVRDLHSMGFAHRDLKPGNITVAPDGQVHLIDYGLVAAANGKDPVFQGTAKYMPVVHPYNAKVERKLLDLFAILRTLYLSPVFMCWEGKEEKFRNKNTLSVFTDKVVRDNSVLKFLLDTRDGAVKHYSADTVLKVLNTLSSQNQNKQSANKIQMVESVLKVLSMFQGFIKYEHLNQDERVAVTNLVRDIESSLIRYLAGENEAIAKVNRDTVRIEETMKDVHPVLLQLERLQECKNYNNLNQVNQSAVDSLITELESRMSHYLAGDDQAFKDVKRDTQQLEKRINEAQLLQLQLQMLQECKNCNNLNQENRVAVTDIVEAIESRVGHSLAGIVESIDGVRRDIAHLERKLNDVQPLLYQLQELRACMSHIALENYGREAIANEINRLQSGMGLYLAPNDPAPFNVKIETQQLKQKINYVQTVLFKLQSVKLYRDDLDPDHSHYEILTEIIDNFEGRAQVFLGGNNHAFDRIKETTLRWAQPLINVKSPVVLIILSVIAAATVIPLLYGAYQYNKNGIFLFYNKPEHDYLKARAKNLPGIFDINDPEIPSPGNLAAGG